jgi:hypothetical protein
MGKTNWKIQFSWVKARVGIHENEVTEKLAKEAGTNLDIKESHENVPKSVVINELGEISADMSKREWNQTTKGKITKE